MSIFHPNGDPKRALRAPTIFEALTEKLGRAPTNAECREECRRIIREARDMRGVARKPQDFDTSPLPLFGDAHLQRELF